MSWGIRGGIVDGGRLLPEPEEMGTIAYYLTPEECRIIMTMHQQKQTITAIQEATGRDRTYKIFSGWPCHPLWSWTNPRRGPSFLCCSGVPNQLLKMKYRRAGGRAGIELLNAYNVLTAEDLTG